jgi:hypothetical protein
MSRKRYGSVRAIRSCFIGTSSSGLPMSISAARCAGSRACANRSRATRTGGSRCQREDRFSRLQRRAATLNRQLGGEGLSTWADPPAKPKWMWWRTYQKKFAAWESIVERANRVFTDPNNADRAPACCVDPDQPVEAAVGPSAIDLEAIEIRPIEVRSRHLGRPTPSIAPGYPGNPKLLGNSGGYPGNQSADRCLAV